MTLLLNYLPCLGHFVLSVRWAKVSIWSWKFNRSNSICFCQIVPKMNFSTHEQNNNAEISCEDSLFQDHRTSEQIFLFVNVTNNEKEEIDESEHNYTFDFFSFSHWFSWKSLTGDFEKSTSSTHQLHLKGNRLSSPSNDQIFIHLFNSIHRNLFSFKHKTIPYKLKIYNKKLLSNCRFYLKISSIHIVEKSQIFFFPGKKTRRLKPTVHRSNPSVRSIHFAKSLKSIKTRIFHWSSLLRMHHWHSSSLPSFHYAQFFSTEFTFLHFDNRTIYSFAFRITTKIHFSFNENHRTVHQYLSKTPIWSSQTNSSSNFIRKTRLNRRKITLKHSTQLCLNTINSTSRTMEKTSILFSLFTRAAPACLPTNNPLKMTNRRSFAANTNKTTKSIRFSRLILVNSSTKTKQNIERCTCSRLFRFHF